MQIYQSTLHYTLVQLGATDPLTKPLSYVEYETAGGLGIRFVDYLVVSFRDDLEEPLYRSWRCMAG